jgi:hypothetical protein
MLFAFSTFRTLDAGEEAMRASDRAFDAAELEVALEQARHAAISYVPGARHVDAAYARLRALALGAERARDTTLAMSAWRAVRAAALETRHVWLPRARELDEANHELARLSGSAGASTERELLEPGSPRVGWVSLLGLGFACGCVGLVQLAGSGLSRAGRWLPTRMRLPGLLVLMGAAVFSLALLRA